MGLPCVRACMVLVTVYQITCQLPMFFIRPTVLKTCFLLFIFSCLLVPPAQAQQLFGAPADTAQPAPAWADDRLGRRTPRGTVEGFISAVAAEDYAKASHFINLDTVKLKPEQRSLQAQNLQRFLDKYGSIYPYSRISDQPEGHSTDDLAPGLDQVGTATVKDSAFAILVINTPGPDGAPVWQFSSDIFNSIPVQAAEQQLPIADRLLPDTLKDTKWGGVPVGHWLIMILLAALAYAVAWSITYAVILVIRVIWPKTTEETNAGIVKAFALPIRLYLAVWLFVLSNAGIGTSIIVRQQFSTLTVIVGLVAFLLLLMRLVDAITSFGKKRLTQRGNPGGISALLFLRRSAKIAILVFGTIAVLSTIGVDVTTGLAALGIGGIALALGAQKTVENFVGSVTLIADQPIRVGDFCKVGDTLGTVEQIGMRSTRIRTNDRTIVTIPNGEFSSLKIENYAHRDRFWFHPILGLRYETTPAQIKTILADLRKLLKENPKVMQDSARVRFIEFGASSLNLELFAYVLAIDFNEYLEVKEELFLQIMEIIENNGSGFAFPSQTLYLAQDQGIGQLPPPENPVTVPV